MHQIRIIRSMKLLWNPMLLQSRTASVYPATRLLTLGGSSCAVPLPKMRVVYFGTGYSTMTAEPVRLNIFQRIITKSKGILDPRKHRNRMLGYLLYENIVLTIGYENFFADFKMADTFYSWFLITELHVWMLMLRFMAEGKSGQDIRNTIVQAMWEDVNKRKMGLPNANIVALKKQVTELSQQFTAAIIGYDEGILLDDKILAAALWRRFFQCECNNPEPVEKLVHYVRKQVSILDKFRSEEIMEMKSIPWLDFRNP